MTQITDPLRITEASPHPRDRDAAERHNTVRSHAATRDITGMQADLPFAVRHRPSVPDASPGGLTTFTCDTAVRHINR